MFNRETVKSTRDSIQAALDTLSEKLGCQIKVGSASFARDGSNCTFNVECAAVGEDGTAETKEVSAFRRQAKLYGLSPDDFGKTFVSGGKKFIICGLSTKARRFPILAKGPNGKSYKFPADTVKLALAAA